MENYSELLSSRDTRCQIQRASSTRSGVHVQNDSNFGAAVRDCDRLIHLLLAELSTAKKDAILGEISGSHLGPLGSLAA